MSYPYFLKWDFKWDFGEQWFGTNLAPVEKDGKWGFKNKNEEIVVPCIYDSVTPFCDEKYAIIVSNKRIGIIDTNGETVLPCMYDNIIGETEGLFVVRLDKYGAVDVNNNIVIPFKYDYMWNFRNGITIAKIDNKCGVIDNKNNIIIDFKYDDIARHFKYDDIERKFKYDNILKVRLNDKYGAINKDNKIIIPIKYQQYIETISKKGLAKVKLNDKVGFIDLEEDSAQFNEFMNMIINIGSRSDTLYYTRYKDTYILSTGCFIGTLEEFEEAVNKEYGTMSYNETFFFIKRIAYLDYMKIIEDLKNTL